MAPSLCRAPRSLGEGAQSYWGLALGVPHVQAPEGLRAAQVTGWAASSRLSLGLQGVGRGPGPRALTEYSAGKSGQLPSRQWPMGSRGRKRR